MTKQPKTWRVVLALILSIPLIPIAIGKYLLGLVEHWYCGGLYKIAGFRPSYGYVPKKAGSWGNIGSPSGGIEAAEQTKVNPDKRMVGVAAGPEGAGGDRQTGNGSQSEGASIFSDNAEAAFVLGGKLGNGNRGDYILPFLRKRVRNNKAKVDIQ